MAGTLSKDITLSCRTSTTVAWTALPDLQEIPELGASVEKVEVTTLADASKKYINGLKDYGDLSFKFLYANDSVADSFSILLDLETNETLTQFKVTFPDGVTYIISGYVTTKINSTGVNAPIGFNLMVVPNSDFVVATEGDTATPVISTASLTAGTNRAFAGTCVSGATVYVIKNGLYLASATVASTNWSYTIPTTSNGEVYTVSAIIATKKEKLAANSITVA
jgi:hypothetical protein